MTNATIVIYIHKKKGAERKKKFSTNSKYDKTSEMGKQNKHYMYQL